MAQEFSSRAVRGILGISQRCLDYWAETNVVTPSARRPHGKGTERRYSYGDLLRLEVVKRLRDGGISLNRIRAAIARLSKNWPGKDPLIGHTLFTDGRRLHRITRDPNVVEEVLSGGQLVFSVVALGRIDAAVRKRVLKFERADQKRLADQRQAG